MELYLINHHLISYSEIFTGLSHWSFNLEFCSTTFNSKLPQIFSTMEKPYSIAFL